MSQQKYTATVRRTMTTWLLLVSFVVASTCVFAADHDKKDLIGDWRGSTTDQQTNGQNSVPVDMQITEVKINEKGGRFHFGPKRSCELALLYKETGPNDSFLFYFVESHGGFCDKLNNALLTLSFQGPDLNFMISPNGAFKGEHGILRKSE
jgi:hypothetical protein